MGNQFNSAFDLPNPGLRAYFEHVVQGQPEVYRTPFYKGRALEDVLSEWMTHLHKLEQQWPTLYQFENDLSKKVGPMSVMQPLSKRMRDIDSYYESIHLDSAPISKQAISLVCKEFAGVAGIRQRSLGRTVDIMKKSTNSGSPYFAKRRTVIDKTIPCSIHQGKQILPSGVYDYAAVLGWRGQEGGPNPEDVKQRVVWMFPFAVNALELQVYQPLIEALQSGSVLVPAWHSMEAVDERITRMFDTKDPDDLVVCTDFSKFDQHFNADMQDASYQILDYLFAGGIKDWLTNVFPIKYEIPLAYDYGKIRTGKHGMGSGSGGTNADETLAHRALQHEAAALHGVPLNANSQCLGDDGILTYPGITVEDVVRAYSSHGQDMNLEKQYASKHDCTYLRRWHHKDYRVNGVCVGVYSTARALGRLAMQERYYDPEMWGPKMVTLRYLSILENVKYHPLKEEFVDFCMQGDKFRLGLDLPNFFSNLDKLAREASELIPDFLGYTKSLQRDGNPRVSGISDWWIVKYLKSKA